MAFLPTSPVERETVHGDNGAIRSLGEQWVRKNYTFISSAKPGRERERQGDRAPAVTVDQGLYLLFSIRAASSRNPWVGQPACLHGKPVEKKSSCEVLTRTLPPLPRLTLPFSDQRFHRIEIWSISRGDSWKYSPSSPWRESTPAFSDPPLYVVPNRVISWFLGNSFALVGISF